MASSEALPNYFVYTGESKDFPIIECYYAGAEYQPITKDPSTTLNYWYLITVEPLLFSI